MNLKEISQSLMNDELPFGFWFHKTIRKIIDDREYYPVKLRRGLLYKFTTSRNESAHQYGPKSTFYGKEKWKYIGHKCVLQWNNPFMHLIELFIEMGRH